MHYVLAPLFLVFFSPYLISSNKPVVTFKKIEGYDQKDALIRYKYQADLWKYQDFQDYRGPRIWATQNETVSIVSDKALYGKEFTAFNIMSDDDLIKAWPLFKKEQGNTISGYFYGDKIRQLDARLKLIRINKFTNAYCTLKESTITQEAAATFLNDHKEIIEECAQGNDPLANILLHGSDKPHQDLRKAFIIYSVVNKKYELLYSYKNKCHHTIQKFINRSTSISENKKDKKNDHKTAPIRGNETHKKEDINQSKKENKNSKNSKNDNNTDKNKREEKLRVWEKGIALLQDGNDKDAELLLSQTINTVLVDKVKEEHKQIVFEKAKAIIKSIRDRQLLPLDRDLLYIYAKIIQRDNQRDKSEDKLRAIDVLFEAATFKGLLLKTSSPTFSPSLFLADTDNYLEQFYETNDDDPVAEKMAIGEIEKVLAADPYSICFLLRALPIANAQYKQVFLDSFLKSKKNMEVISTHNVITWPLRLSHKSLSLIKDFKYIGEKQLIIKTFIDFIEFRSKCHDLEYQQNFGEIPPKDRDQVIKTLITDFLKYKDVLKSKESLLWFDVVKYTLFRMLQRREGSDDTLVSECLSLFDIPEHRMRRLWNLQEFGNFTLKISTESTFLEKLLTLKLGLRSDTGNSNHGETVKLKNDLVRKVLHLLCDGPKEYFKLVIDKTRMYSLSFWKMREIILSYEKNAWENLLRELEQHTKLMPLVYTVLGTDITNRVVFSEDESGLIFAHKGKESQEEHFSIVAMLLEKAASEYADFDIQDIEKYLFERSLLSMIYLAETSKELKPLLDPLLNNIIQILHQHIPRMIEKNDKGQKYKSINFMMTYPFGCDFLEIEREVKTYLSKKKK